MYTDVLLAFESITKSKYVLAKELTFQWFLNALGEYELNVGSLNFDEEKKAFIPTSSEFFDSKGNLRRHIILNLAEIMKSYQLEQEVRRVNQLNNIVGKDISLNGTGDTKRFTREEANSIDAKIADLFAKQQDPAYT